VAVSLVMLKGVFASMGDSRTGELTGWVSPVVEDGQITGSLARAATARMSGKAAHKRAR
jgi:hypothetical protein